MEEQELATERGAQHILTKKGSDKNQDEAKKKEVEETGRGEIMDGGREGRRHEREIGRGRVK